MSRDHHRWSIPEEHKSEQGITVGGGIGDRLKINWSNSLNLPLQQLTDRVTGKEEEKHAGTDVFAFDKAMLEIEETPRTSVKTRVSEMDQSSAKIMDAEVIWDEMAQGLDLEEAEALFNSWK